MVEVSIQSGSQFGEHPTVEVPIYSTKEKMIHAWVAMIIVNIIMGILFPQAWWAGLICFIMNIRAIVITLHYVGHLYHCPKCHRLVEGLEMNCRYCGQPLTTADNIHYRIHEHAVRFAAEMQQRAELYKQQAYRTYHVSPQNVPKPNVVVPSEKKENVHYCTACGTQISANGQFCPLCGQKERFFLSNSQL